MTTTLSTFAQQLRAWRKSRGLSQLDLALVAETTQRHLSFLETGRSRPGRALVIRLANGLGLGPRDTNALLDTVGLPRVYSEFSLDDEALAPAMRIVNSVLSKHEPYPAWAIASGLRFIAANRSAERIMPGLIGMSLEALIELWCQPDEGESEADALRRTLTSLRHEFRAHPHPELGPLLKKLEDRLRADGTPPTEEECARPPLLTQTMTFRGTGIETFSTVLRFDKAEDVSLSEMRIELVFPADEEASARFHEWAAR